MAELHAEVAISRMYHWELPRMSLNVLYGLQQSHTVIVFPLMISWSKVVFFFSSSLAVIIYVRVRPKEMDITSAKSVG